MDRLALVMLGPLQLKPKPLARRGALTRTCHTRRLLHRQIVHQAQSPLDLTEFRLDAAANPARIRRRARSIWEKSVKSSTVSTSTMT
jgi:hypothetical protein